MYTRSGISMEHGCTRDQVLAWMYTRSGISMDVIVTACFVALA